MTASSESPPYRKPQGAPVPDNADAFRAALRLGARYRIRLGWSSEGVWTVHPQTKLESNPDGPPSAMTYYAPGEAREVPHELAMQFIDAAVHVSADAYERDDPDGKDPEGITRGRVMLSGGVELDAEEWAAYQRWRFSGNGYEDPSA